MHGDFFLAQFYLNIVLLGFPCILKKVVYKLFITLPIRLMCQISDTSDASKMAFTRCPLRGLRRSGYEISRARVARDRTKIAEVSNLEHVRNPRDISVTNVKSPPVYTCDFYWELGRDKRCTANRIKNHV